MSAPYRRLTLPTNGVPRNRQGKQIIDLRPVYHHLEDRIRAHVTLCWLALLLIRITETTTGQTWNHLRAEMPAIKPGDDRRSLAGASHHRPLTTASAPQPTPG